MLTCGNQKWIVAIAYCNLKKYKHSITIFKTIRIICRFIKFIILIANIHEMKLKCNLAILIKCQD